MRTIVGAIVALALTVLVFGTIYVVAQQTQRQGADDAPARLASAVAADGSLATAGRFDLRSRLDAFAMRVRPDGRIIRDAVTLDGRPAVPPAGVLAAAVRSGTDRVTWEPAPGLRFAVVAVSSGGEVVVAGQSLAPAERRIDQLGILIATAGFATAAVAIVGLYAAVGWSRAIGRRDPATSPPRG